MKELFITKSIHSTTSHSLNLINRLNSTPGVPPVACVVSDGLMSFGIEAAKEVGVPEVQFWTASACSLMGYLHFRELIKRGIFPMKERKPHAVCVPFPAQGHVTPMMKLAQLLHSRGFFITYVNTEFNHKRLVRSRGPEYVEGYVGFQFKTIPDGLPPSDRDATQDPPALCASLRTNCLGPFRALLTELNSSAGTPQVSYVVSDGIMGFGREAAEELGIPEVQFWTASACGLMGYLQYPELIEKGIVPFKGT
ncbi:hypothetical protein RHSIM_Rhsim08G0012200 [Rhododendron simsii]|uniref:Glycosyltransferase N-terminal domain-containing protein n=1 Tax=Rhododendron simsii TaxID=118357 RepID=A0A834GJ42_RHOSS|nr:hypothetical protein RHSIM_Rhsim08G0012200 [Rhododendron simsii]